MINSLYRHLLRPYLFKISQDDPEIAHDRVMRYLRGANSHPDLCRLLRCVNCYNSSALRQQFCGVIFPNPVGLAAGFDKNAECPWSMAACGFGFLGIGGVVPHGQLGNDRPRIIRIPEEKSLANRMGFNSHGCDIVRDNLAAAGKLPIPLIANLGKMKNTPNEYAGEDYWVVLKSLYEYADLFVINVSSPNTPGLRTLQQQGYLRILLQQVQAKRQRLAAGKQPKPLGIKLSPNLTDYELDETIAVCLDYKIDFVVLVNTDLVTIEGLTYGKSGQSLRSRAKEVVKYIHRHTEGKWPIIGCGGIDSPEAAYEMLEAGANLVEILTGLFYEGPLLPKAINKGLVKILREENVSSIGELASTRFLRPTKTASPLIL